MSFLKINSIRHMMDIAVNTCGEKCAFKFRKDRNEIAEVSFREFYNDTYLLGAGLIELGLETGHIACIAKNSYRWIVSYISRLMSRGVFVPIDKELPENDMLNVLCKSDAVAVFYDKSCADILKKYASRLSNIKYFISLDDDALCNDRFITYSSVMNLGKLSSVEKFKNSINHDMNALKLLVFTSGTTGNAKGVMLTENNIISVINNGLEVCQPLSVGLSVLPYCHTYEAVTNIISSIHCHCTMCINTSLKRVLDDFKLFKPDYIFIVPLFAEMFINGIKRKVIKEGKEEAFKKGIKICKFFKNFGFDVRRKVFSEVLEGFGGNLKLIICGGAPIRKEVGEFFDIVGISLVSGYGITECSPLVSVNSINDNSFETVGHKLQCVKWKIDLPNDEGEGEILIKSPTVMKGYYKEPEKTAAVFRDGWFCTGDYGKITEDGKLIITGRKKNLIVLKNGKNVYPEEIENLIMNIDYISEVIVKSIKNDFNEETGLIAEIYGDGLNEKSYNDIAHDINIAVSELPNYKHIDEIVIRDKPFEKTVSRKIIRK